MTVTETGPSPNESLTLLLTLSSIASYPFPSRAEALNLERMALSYGDLALEQKRRAHNVCLFFLEHQNPDAFTTYTFGQRYSKAKSIHGAISVLFDLYHGAEVGPEVLWLNAVILENASGSLEGPTGIGTVYANGTDYLREKWAAVQEKLFNEEQPIYIHTVKDMLKQAGVLVEVPPTKWSDEA